ncbi:MAG: hypothetical protein H6719_16295 [Sandaracinaceae bacterium]|nr:hypothetical protein [Sandaracinaceae bacterium]
MSDAPEPTATPLPRARADVRVGVGLSLVAFVVALASVAPQFVPSTWIIRDCRFHTNVNQTIVESASFEQHAFASSWYDADLGWNRDLDPAWSNVALGRNGEYWPKHTWLLPVLSTPVYWAFGLLGTLIFNLAMFGWITAAGYRFGREYASPTAAAVAVGIFLFGTAILESAYNYSADLLQVALFLTGLAFAVSRRPIPAGIFVALAVIVRPTALILFLTPVLIYVERRAWRELGRALLAGTATLAAFGAINTYMYGRPWWTGYNRTVVTVGGSPTVASHVDAFGTPLAEGLQRTFFGGYPLGRAFAVLPLGLPGLVALLRRGRWTMIGLVVGVLASVYVFARYTYEGHRFHWIALSLALPAIAATVDGIASAAARLPGHHRLPVAAAVGAVAVAVTALFWDPIDATVANGGWRVATESLAAGALDLHARFADDAFRDVAYPELSSVAAGPGGIWLGRVPLPALLLGAPFAAAGPWGLAVLHLLALGLAAFFATSFLRRLVPAPLAALAVCAPLMLPSVRDAVIDGGPLLLALPMAFGALHFGARGRWALAGALAALAGWTTGSLWLGLPALLPLLVDRRAWVGAAKGAGPVLALFAIASTVLYGAPFATPDDAVVVGDAVVSAPRRDLLDALHQSVADQVPTRLLWPLLALAPVGVVVAWQRDRRLAAALGLTALAALAPAVGTHSPDWAWDPLSTLLVAAPLALVGDGAARAWDAVPRRWRRGSVALGATLAALFVVGGASRLVASAEPFSIASFAGVRGAVVMLDDRIPCDFLAWEHLSWECSQYDRGLTQMVGRATSSRDVRVAGVRRELLLVPSGAGGRPRTVTWPEAPAGRELVLRWAVPDGERGGATLVVRVDDEERARIEVPLVPDGELHEVRIDTARSSGSGRLQLEMRSHTAAVAVVGLEGVWR